MATQPRLRWLFDHQVDRLWRTINRRKKPLKQNDLTLAQRVSFLRIKRAYSEHWDLRALQDLAIFVKFALTFAKCVPNLQPQFRAVQWGNSIISEKHHKPKEKKNMSQLSMRKGRWSLVPKYFLLIALTCRPISDPSEPTGETVKKTRCPRHACGKSS